MDIALTHHFDHPIDAVWAMMHDPAAHVAKFESMGHRDLEVLREDVGDDALDIEIRRNVEIDVPGIARKFITPSNTVTSTDRWERRSDTELGGHFEIDIKGVPVESKGTTHVVPHPDGGCRYDVTLQVKVKVPLVGEKVAQALRGQLEDQLKAEFTAGDAWLAGH